MITGGRGDLTFRDTYTTMSYLNINSGPSYGALDTQEQTMDREDQRLLYESFAEEGDRRYEEADDDVLSTSESDVQEGVRKIEAISQTWTPRSLIVAYLRLVDRLDSRGSLVVLTKFMKYFPYGVLYISGGTDGRRTVRLRDQFIQQAFFDLDCTSCTERGEW